MYRKMLPTLSLALLITNAQAQTMVPKLDQEGVAAMSRDRRNSEPWKSSTRPMKIKTASYRVPNWKNTRLIWPKNSANATRMATVF